MVRRIWLNGICECEVEWQPMLDVNRHQPFSDEVCLAGGLHLILKGAAWAIFGFFIIWPLRSFPLLPATTIVIFSNTGQFIPMIEIQQLTEEELNDLRSEARASVMALPFLLIIATILAWLFDFYWVSFFIMAIIISVIFLFLYLNQGKDTIDDDIKEGVKLLRMGKIVDITMQTGVQTRIKSVDITLEEEPIPDPYPEIHTFGIYNSLIQLYHEPYDSLPARHQSLKGKTILIEYFPYSGHVLSFEEEDKSKRV